MNEIEEMIWEIEQRQRALQSQGASMEERFNKHKEFQDEWNTWKEKIEKLEKDVWAIIEKVEKTK